jgi:hypothetical protein
MRELARGLALAVVFAGASGGCTLLLDTDANPHSCNVEADCARLPNAVCDNARRICVPRLPAAGDDGGAPMDAGVDDTGGGLMCELAFDNAARITMTGPDGGLRPLPEGP